MASRGRGRGRGQSAGHKPYIEGITRKAVVMRDTTYPPNDSVQRAFPPEDSEKRLIFYNRSVQNYLMQSEFYMPTMARKAKIRSYKGDSANLKDLGTQMEHIISYCGPLYFPAELRQATFNPEGRTRVKLKKKAKDGSRSDSESKSESGEPVDEGDFGGEDYAHDYYLDEEREDADDDVDGAVF